VIVAVDRSSVEAIDAKSNVFSCDLNESETSIANRAMMRLDPNSTKEGIDYFYRTVVRETG
jgi:hypothetical protein